MEHICIAALSEKDTKCLAVEVETGKSNSIYNVRMDLRAGFDEVVVICLTKAGKEKVSPSQSELGLSENEKVKILEVHDI